jgi:hypothetical protein
MKFTIDLSEELSEKFQQYIARENEYCAKMAEECEQEGRHIVADCLRIPLTPERAVTQLIIQATRERR